MVVSVRRGILRVGWIAVCNRELSKVCERESESKGKSGMGCTSTFVESEQTWLLRRYKAFILLYVDYEKEDRG